ncbi:MAG: chromosome segregation protein SMC [Ignavibacteriales bacterium]|nr:chromosome segregation protein SMC [Ignavibacteriales bacterium]
MYLSKIEVIGFKSFAQRINVNFDVGVTAIVGPNGCGKTNIVDAIRWALGEQRYSTLRSDKMEDVIFNGTKTRKPLGLAEVSLTIENTKGILPTDYSEVTITRRVFRSGESEYLLNKVPCRLKDIVDLFMDTGMGSDAYSVIELKMVETILSDKTDERRKLFEEAAGVTKYKVRRKAAMRRLGDVQQDLARVNDIVKEVQKTVNSLERQAKKAEQYNEVTGRLKALEIDLLEREYSHLHNKLQPLEEKFKIASIDKSKIDEALKAEEDRVDVLQAELTGREKDLNTAQKSASAKFAEVHSIEEKMLVTQERRNSLEVNINRYQKEKLDLFQQQEALAIERVSFNERKVEQDRNLSSFESIFENEKKLYTDLTKEYTRQQSEVEMLKDEILKTAHEVVEKRGETERSKTRIDNLKGRIERALEESTLYDADILRVEDQIKEHTTRDRDLRKQFAEAEVVLFSRQQKKENLRREIDSLRKKGSDISYEIERKTSKIDFLLRMLEGFEGTSDGNLYLLTDGEWKKKNFVTVGDVVQVEEKYRELIETALGDFAHALVVESIEDGYKAIESLKKQGKGKSSFISLDSLPIKIRRGKTKFPNGCFNALDVVGCEKKYLPLVEFLLDDVLIFDNSVSQRESLRNITGKRLLSLDGYFQTSSGFIRGGSKKAGEAGYIGKKTQITELQKEIKELQDELKKIEENHNALQQEFNAIHIDDDRKNVKVVEKEMTAVEMKIAQFEFEKKRANDGLERNQQEISLVEQEIGKLENQLRGLSEQLLILENIKTEKETTLTASQSNLEQTESIWTEKAKTVNDLEIKVVTLRGEIRNLERDIERAEERRKDIDLTIERRESEIDHAKNEIGRLEIEFVSLESQVTLLRNEYEQLQQRRNEIEQIYTSLRGEIHKIELKIKDERRLHDDSVSAAHDLEMKISEIRSNIEHLINRAKEEFELTLQIKEYPDDEWVDFAHLREEVKILKDRIKILGAINFAAFDEFTTESERLNFLSQQRDDLLEAEKTLLTTIEEINNTAQRKFLETFGAIRNNFITTFKELFLEGDECDLKLEENVDPLEANIEIIAKPRGKRPTSIDLLSGGEKTLTAIALLFAIYLVKPSPFCILDEVDAPLDDSNIDRYARILKKFSNNTQFIVVTHNKRTMESAQALYGVTMEEEGVSKIVTVRFNEDARVRSATVTN